VDRIVFENGKAVSSAYLNEVQKGTSFSGESRTDYYTEPSPTDEAGWKITQRDRLKDWEIADPRIDRATAVGRLAHDGLVLGWEDGELVVPGLPATRPVNDGIGVTVEAGSMIGRAGTPLSWPRQTVQILGGAGSTSYLYVSEADALSTDPVPVSISGELPSVTEPHVPLAKLVLNSTGDGLATDPLTGDVIGTGYIDLRPNTFTGNLNTYPQNLTNTAIKSEDYSISVWDRVIADTSNGSIVLTLPESPSDSDRIAIVDISGTFDQFPLIIRPNDELLNNSSDDWIVNIRDAHLELFYHAATGQWKFEEAPGSECSPVLGTFLSCGGREFIGDRTATECPDGAIIPGRYPDPSPGVYSFEPSESDPVLGKCFKVYNETVSLFANGTGGLITVAGAPRCIRTGLSTTNSIVARNSIYVDCSIGDDSIDNNGFDQNRPFRTLERALIEAARESRRAGFANDRYDRIMVELAPGDYYVDNTPGSLATLSPTDETGLLQRVNTNFTVIGSTSGDRTTEITVDVLDSVLDQPPPALNLGRVLYSQSGGVGNISRIEKDGPSSSIWHIMLEYVRGDFNANDQLYYDNLAAVNPQTGGLIVPRGISIDGTDLRKVRLRPMYVPALAPVQNDPQAERTSILKVTGGTYVSLLTFTDNQQFPRSHNTVTAVTFASQAEINGGGNETSYYSRLNSLFAVIDGWNDQGLEPIPAETTIVAPIAASKENRSQDIEENQTGLLVAGGDSRINAPLAYPGATRIRDTDGTILPLPDINSTRSSSPYVFNCSVRSIFGMNGLWANGSIVAGFKSMVTANFTQVSLQTDPNCFTPTTYFLDPPVQKDSGEGKQYKTCSTDEFKYRHFGMRGSNDATIQIVSVFVIGNSDHFVSENGADLSITNSCSDFGDISLRSLGYKAKAFSQDEATSSPGYGGTRITQIIPPLPLSYSQLSDGRPPTLEDVEINTGLTIDYDKTLAYVLANKTPGNQPPATIRVYVQNSNIAAPLSLLRPPSASDIAFGQYTYTREVTEGAWELSGGPSRANRKRIYVSGFDESGESILYAGDIQLAPFDAPGFSALDSSSKIFIWDANPVELDENGDIVASAPGWYVNVTTTGIVEEATDTDGDGYLLKKFDYAFRYKLIPSPSQTEAVFAALDFMFDRSAVKIIRAIDRRKADDRVYRVILDGYIKEGRGLRRPQSYYIMEKQEGVPGFPLNSGNELTRDPLTITQVKTYDEVFRPGKTDVQFPGTYVTYLTQSSKSRDVFTGDLYPSLDQDYPELTENPANSITRIALEAMLSRTSVYFSSNLVPSTSLIDIKTSASASASGIRISLRRPSIIRASGHTWEWTGYLNYDTAFPTFQGDPLEQDLALGKIIVEENGGRVYATGMNEEGNYYLGTTVFDLRSGEQFSIPLAADGETGNVTNQILSNVIIRNTLLMQDGSSLVMGRETTLFFSNDTQFKSLTTGDIVASRNPPAVYATRSKAGLVQLADSSMIRGAKGTAATGVSDKAVVTALDLANELDVRFENSVSGGNGVTVTSTSIDLPGGDPGSAEDNIVQFSINIGLPLNQDIVPFAGIRLGSQSGQIANTISTSVNKSSARAGALVTETALRNYLIGTDQLEDTAVTTAKLANGAVTEVKILDGSVTTNKINNLAVTTGKLADTSVTEAKISDNAVTTGKINALAVTEAKISDNAVTTGKINALAVTEAKIASGSVTFTKVASTSYRTSTQGVRIPANATDSEFATEKAISSYVDLVKGDLQGEIGTVSNGIVPIGGIIMWSGSVVPTRWALCDGTNSTPDLRDRFIVGSGTTYATGDTGGSASVTLTTNQIPSHNHKLFHNSEGPAAGDINGNYSAAYTKDTGGPGSYLIYSTTANQEPNTYRSGNTGGGEAHENRPPYYALAFIMRTS
jgi:microcystin-dependent protein